MGEIDKKTFWDKVKEKRDSLFGWVRDHPKETVIGGIAIASISGVALYLLGRREGEDEYIVEEQYSEYSYWEEEYREYGTLSVEPCHEEEKAIEIFDSSKEVFVREHKRNLPETWNASPQKIEYAKEHGIQLEEHQTVVVDYTYEKGIKGEEESFSSMTDEEWEEFIIGIRASEEITV